MRFELQNNTSILHSARTIRYGIRARRESDRSQSPSGFGGGGPGGGGGGGGGSVANNRRIEFQTRFTF